MEFCVYSLYSQHDVALIELKTAVPKTVAVGIALDNKNNYPFGAGIAGYGMTCYGPSSCDYTIGTLYEGVVRTVSDKFCQETFKKRQSPRICTKAHSWPLPHNENICYGDSGGPLIAAKNNKPLLIGVLSVFDSSVGACVIKNTAGYAPTFRYQKWISQYVNRSVKIEVPRFQLSGPQKNRSGVIRIRNLSSRFSLPLKEIRVRVAGLYCRTRNNSLPLSQCSINNNFAGGSTLQSFWGYSSSPDINSDFKEGPFKVVSSNCPRGFWGTEAYLNYLISNQLPVLKPNQSCQIKIKIKPPESILLRFKNKYANYSSLSGIRGAELFEVSIDTLFDVDGYQGAVISTCTDSIPPMPAVLWYGNCKRDLKTLKASSAGQFLLNECSSSQKYFPESDSTQYLSPKCYNLLQNIK